MTSIIRYRIVSDALTTYRLKEPNGPDATTPRCTELCTLDDGYTYVTVPEGVTLPNDQPESVAATLQEVALTDELRGQILTASTHCQLIAERVIERIRGRYPLDEELFLNRIATGVLAGLYQYQPGEEEEVLAFGAWAEDCRQWGRQQRAVLGL
jgi:hypothetical protein